MDFELQKKYVIKFNKTEVWTCVGVTPLGTAVLSSPDKKRELFVPKATTDWLEYRDPIAGDYYVLLWINVLERDPMVQSFITADYTKFREQYDRCNSKTDLKIVHENHVIWSEDERRK